MARRTRPNHTADINIGDGATIAFWSDRAAGTVIAKTGSTVTIQEDTAVRIDANGMSDAQTYAYTPNPDGRIFVVRRRASDGRFVNRNGGYRASFGGRRAYYDFSF